MCQYRGVVGLKDWIPRCVRYRAPEEYRLRYQASGHTVSGRSGPSLESVLDGASDVSRWSPTATGARIELETTTWVYGLIRREVIETMELDLSQGPQGPVIVIRCRPQGHHEAHAAGIAGVVALAGASLLIGPTVAGTTLLAGALWTVYVRELALDRFVGRLKNVLGVIGDTLWPGGSSEIVQL